MRLFVLFSLMITCCCCRKNATATSEVVAYLRIYDVTQDRDSTNSVARFRVSITPQLNKEVTVKYTTENGSAIAITDYTARSGVLTLPANQTEAFIDVPVVGRVLKQSDQQFYLIVSNPVNAQLENDRATATLRNLGKYELAWSDEFNGTALNTNDWSYETGGNGWGNNELQNYLAGTANAYLQNGNLVIEAKKETSGSNNYTSARLTTKGKRFFTYGKMEFRAKLPITKGIWPALWMLGENISTVNWPACGELDIMELIGKEPSVVYGTAHWGTTANHQSANGNFRLSNGDYSQDFHVFTMEWDAQRIQFFMDGNKYKEVTAQQVGAGAYPFDKPFFFIVNVAVGGDWPGSPDATSTFPQKMLVDYVRVYQK